MCRQCVKSSNSFMKAVWPETAFLQRGFGAKSCLKIFVLPNPINSSWLVLPQTVPAQAGQSTAQLVLPYKSSPATPQVLHQQTPPPSLLLRPLFLVGFPWSTCDWLPFFCLVDLVKTVAELLLRLVGCPFSALWIWLKRLRPQLFGK